MSTYDAFVKPITLKNETMPPSRTAMALMVMRVSNDCKRFAKILLKTRIHNNVK